MHDVVFALPTRERPAECLSEIANILCLFTDIFESPKQAGNGDDLRLSFLGAFAAGTILASMEEALREVAYHIEEQEKKHRQCTCEKGGKG